MSRSVRSLQVRSFLESYFSIIVFVLLLVAAVGGFVAYEAHFTEETETEQRTVDTWTVDAEFQHGATVQHDGAIFARGDRFENRTVYFTRITPELDGAYALTAEGNDGTTAVVELTLVIRATEEIGDREVVHWRETSSLGSEEGSLDGDGLQTEFTVNVTEMSERIAEIEEDMGATPGTTEMLIRSDAMVEGSLDGSQVDDARAEILVLEPRAGTYRVEPRLEEPTTREATETVETPVQPSPLAAYGAPSLAALSLLGVLGLVIIRHRGLLTVTPEERHRHDFEAARADFDDWITSGELVADHAGRVVRVGSLKGVVDVAIDSGRRVIETPDGCYVVLLDDVCYVFEPAIDDDVEESDVTTDGTVEDDVPTNRDGSRHGDGEEATDNSSSDLEADGNHND